MALRTNSVGVRRLLALLTALAWLVLVGHAARAATVSAGFRISETPKLKVSFLHNLSASAPSDELLVPLRPTAWRSSEASGPADRVRRLGASHTIVLSDHWSYPAHGWRPAGPPWTQLEGFAAWVRQFAQRYKGRGLLYWDIWNEPDFKIFWDGTREEFYETFAVAERVLREELGSDARIVGPSTTMWRLDWIEGLAEFCLERGCRFDAVSWHDLPDDMRSLPRLSERVETTRALLSQARYQSLGVREFHVKRDHGARHPVHAGRCGRLLLGAREPPGGRGDQVVLAGRPGTGELGRPDTRRPARLGHRPPRSLWYTWRAYADGRSSRVRSRSRDQRIALLASRRSRRPGEAQLLLGNLGTVKRDASVRLCGLRELTAGRKLASSARLLAERHPDVEEAVFSRTLDGQVGRLRVTQGGRCGVGRLALPEVGGALVAYLQAR